jgi:indoleamine 2,3-dioxygenase
VIGQSQFFVGNANGFLPRQLPLEVLPAPYGKLDDLLRRMPITKKDGSPGLLASGDFGDAVLAELPDHTADIEKETDTRILTALFRDYAFMTSAYLLEPCDIAMRNTGKYGLGRDVLPRKIAVPFSKLAEKLSAKPFLEYAYSYALANYAYKDPSAPEVLAHENLRTIRGFDGGDSESGFILVHVAMVTHSGELVTAMRKVLDAYSWRDREAFNSALHSMHSVLTRIVTSLATMWKKSDAKNFARWRTFIMGTYNQPMFPNGVIYEGVSPEPVQYRGASGAMDSLVPAIDNILQVTEMLPDNPLTEVLMDFRRYRPVPHNDFLNQLVERAGSGEGLVNFAKKDALSLVLYLQNLDVIREFRMIHWNLTREFVFKYSAHPVATGGSPILSWLPNQLLAVLSLSIEISKEVDVSQLDDHHAQLFDKLRKMTAAQDRVLKRELAAIQAKCDEAAMKAPICKTDTA